jgi:hypothetical protein
MIIGQKSELVCLVIGGIQAITIDVARTSFAGNFSQPMSEFVAQKNLL